MANAAYAPYEADVGNERWGIIVVTFFRLVTTPPACGCRDSGIIDVQCTSLTRVECKTRHVRDSDQAGRANEGERNEPGQLRRLPSQKFQKWLLYIFVNHLFVRRRFLVYPFSNIRNSSNIISGGLLSSLRGAFRREKCQPSPYPLPHAQVSWIGISLFGIELVVELLRSTSLGELLIIRITNVGNSGVAIVVPRSFLSRKSLLWMIVYIHMTYRSWQPPRFAP